MGSTKRNSFSLAASRILQNFEEVLETLGGFGKFQILIIVLLFSLEVPVALVAFIPIFIGANVNWQCEGGILTDASDICSCNGTLTPIEEEEFNTIVSEWDLICDKVWVSDFFMSVQMVGMFVGNLIGSQFADWYGRRTGFLLSTLLVALGSAASAVAPDMYIYAFSRLVCGIGIPAFINITCMGVLEFMPPKYRSVASAVDPTGEGMIILAVLAYFIREWRHLYWATISPFFLIVFIYPFVPESPRWLLKQGRIDEAHAVLQYMAKVNNKKELSKDMVIRLAEKEKETATKEAANSNKRVTYIDFLKSKEMRKTSFYLMCIWFAWSFTFYGVSYNIKYINGDIYLSFFLFGVANATGGRLSMLINNRMGRRGALLLALTITATFLVAVAVTLHIPNIPEEHIDLIMLICCSVAHAGLACGRNSAKLLTGESFPTAMRTMAMGLGGFAANLAGITTPQLALIGSIWPPVPYLAFATVGVLGALVSFLMEETTGKPLDERQGEVQNAIESVGPIEI